MSTQTDPKPKLVKFQMSRNIWNKVVADANEKLCVESEGSDDFVVEYENHDEFHKALQRFQGLIEFEELN